jgi:hypothetical protein
MLLNIDFVYCVNNAVKMEIFFENLYKLCYTKLYSAGIISAGCIIMILEPVCCVIDLGEQLLCLIKQQNINYILVSWGVYL